MQSGTSYERAKSLTAKDIFLTETQRFMLFKDIKMLWHLGYYDGPISGICLNLKDNKQYYFDQIGEFEYLDYSFPDEGTYPREAFRIYAVYELTAEQVEYHNYWHSGWQKDVGTHTDYNEDGTRNIGALQPNWITSGFYEKYKASVYPAQDKKFPIGWFVW